MIAAGAVGPMAGTVLVLLTKPLGGVVGVPGVVVGYIALSASALGCLALVFLRRWRVTVPGRWAGLTAVVGGAAIVVAGVFPDVTALTIGTMLAGTLAGPLVVAARTASGVRTFHVLMVSAAIAGAGAAAGWAGHPGRALAVAGILAVLAGAGLAALNTAPTGSSGGPVEVSSRVRWFWSLYGAGGFVIGGTVLPALHLLLFRWNVRDADQPIHLLAALIPAVLVAVAGILRAPAPLLVLCAGGPLLVATAPGAWQTTIGVAVTLAATVRVFVVADSSLRQWISQDRWQALAAPTLLVLAVAGFAGLGTAAGLERLWGTGSALTLLSLPVLAVALAARRCPTEGVEQ